MAWLEQDPSKRFHICFRFSGNKFRRSLKTSKKKEAETRLSRLEETIRLVESGRLEIPADTDAAKFLLSDGKVTKDSSPAKPIYLTKLFDQFFDSLPESSLEKSTIDCMKIHRRHFERVLSKRCRVDRLTIDQMQSYVSKRSREPGRRGRTVCASTIKKELVTFRSV